MCELAIKLNKSIFCYDLFWNEIDELLPNLKAAIVRHLMSFPSGCHLKQVKTASVIADLKRISLDDKIRLVYRLK